MATTEDGAQPPENAASVRKKVALQVKKRDRSPTPVLDERTRKAAEALSPLYKQLNNNWEAIEKKLRNMLPPREAWISYDREADDPVEPQGYMHACIGLIKYRGEWRLCHGRFYDPQEWEPDAWRPIVECSVDERVKTVDHVDELREKVLEEAEKSIPIVSEAAEKLAQALKRF